MLMRMNGMKSTRQKKMKHKKSCRNKNYKNLEIKKTKNFMTTQNEKRQKNQKKSICDIVKIAIVSDAAAAAFGC